MTLAAERFALTLPTASRMLKKLRTIWQDPLFVRSHPNLIATPRAHELYASVSDIVARLERLKQPVAFDPRTLKRTFSIAAVDNAVVCVLDGFFEQFYRSAPLCRLEFRPLEKDVFARLADGSLDVGLLPSIHPIAPKIQTMELYRNRFCLCVRQDHPLVALCRKKGAVCAADLRGYRKVVVANAQSLDEQRYRFDIDMFHGQTVQETAVTVPYFIAVPAILARTDFTALLPEETALKLSGWRNFPIAALPYCPDSEESSYWTRLIWHECTAHDTVLQWFRGLFAASSRKQAGERASSHHEAGALLISGM